MIKNVPFLQALNHSKFLRTLHHILFILIARIFPCIYILSSFSTLCHHCPDSGLSVSSVITKRFVYLFIQQKFMEHLLSLQAIVMSSE